MPRQPPSTKRTRPRRNSAVGLATPQAQARGAAAFAEHLALIRPEIEQRLRVCWDTKLHQAKHHGSQVAMMVSAARDLTLRGGKRFRAALLAAAYAGVAPRARLDVAFEAGTAIELLQSYLLMQDDWMDGDATRRGGPSVHAALGRALRDVHRGNAAAILSSDLTWGIALDTLAAIDAPAPRLVETIRLFIRIHEDVVFGQQLDLLGSTKDVEKMHALKTGSYTVRGPLLLGATLGGGSAEELASLARYAEPLGVAFQLRDDLLGAFGAKADTGKAEGGDLRAGKRTAVLAEAEPRLDAAGRRAIKRVLGRADADRADLREATRTLETCGARAAVEQRLADLCAEAESIAVDLPLAARARTILLGAAGAFRLPPPRPEASR